MPSNTAAIASGRTKYNGYTATRPAVLGFAKLLFLGLFQFSYTSAAPVRTFLRIAKDGGQADAEDPSMWLYLSVAAVLVLLGGAFAGLTIALMGQDGVYLQVIATSGEGKEQRHAQRVYKLLQRGKHWVLVTLLLSNVIVNESLPIVLDRSLGGGWPAVLGSTVLIVIFGEVIPQSVCVRYGLSIGAYMAPFVLALMWLLAPIAWPTAKLLDKLLGEDHGTVYKKSGLKTLVTLHKTLGPSPSDRLNQDEVTIISAVLDLKDKAVGDIMTPMEDVFTMSADTVLDEKTMNNILTAGYSRIPIYEPGNPGNFVGMLLVKILITYDPEDCKHVSDFALATLPETRFETSCLDIVNFFQEGKSHMVLVSEFPGENYGAIGVVTLEDVIEELIGEEIIDESDVYIDVHKAIRRIAPAPKARVQKGHAVEHPISSVVNTGEDQLIDLTDDLLNGDDGGGNMQNRGEGRKNSQPTFGTSPKTTFFRRGSGGVDGNTIAIRGNVNDMREHLKHLGPSNLASRPKMTKYNTVKIKPGHVPNRSNSKADSIGHRDSIVEEPYQYDATSHGGEGEGLLRSAGKDAKDGVQALQQGYGTLGQTDSQSPKTASRLEEANFDGPKDLPKTLGSQASRNQDAESQTTTGSESHHSDRSSDTLGSLRSRGHSPTRRKKGTARSGSITENVFEAGGVRKVVLETNSSEEDKDNLFYSKPDGNGSGTNTPKAPAKGTPDRTRQTGNPSLDNQIERPDTPKEEDVKKKQKRRRKRKAGKSAEDHPEQGSSAH